MTVGSAGRAARLRRPAGPAGVVGILALGALLTANGCAHPSSRAQGAAPAAPQADKELVAGGQARHPDPQGRPMMQVLAWARLADAAPLVKALARVGGMQAPPGEEAEVARALFGQLVGLDPALGAALDLRRPAVIALLRPDSNDSGPPLLALLPVASREAVVDGAKAAGLRVEVRPFGVVLRPGSVQPTQDRRGATPPAAPPELKPGTPPEVNPGTPPPGEPEAAAFVSFADGYAAVAFREDRAAAAGATLLPLVHARAEAPLAAHLDVARLFETWGAPIERTLARFARVTQGASDPQVAYALRGARRMLRFADSVDGIDLLLDSDAQGVTVTARAEGRPGGPFSAYVASQQSGAPWGLELLPRDAVLVYATRRGAAAAAEELDAAVELLGDAARPPADAPQRAEWRQALGRAGAEMPGELVYAVWPVAGAGIGVGGAWRVRPGPAARRETMAAYRRIGDRMAGMVARSLRLDPERFPLHVRVRPGALHVDGVVGDIIEVTVRWPAAARAERRQLRELVGEPLRMAVVFDGERAMFAIGADAKARVGTMLAAARGTGGATLADDPRLRAALTWRPEARVSLSFLATAPMASLLARLIHGGAPEAAAGVADAALADAGDGAILATTNASGRRYEVSTRLPLSSLPGLTRVSGVLWRMALSPLLNPPAMPPLPLPPAHLRPQSAPHRSSASAPSKHL